MADDQTPPPGVPRWRGQVKNDPHRPALASSKQKKIFALLALMLALGATALAWLLFVRPMEAPFFLTLPIREYSVQELPTNALAVQDSDLLLQHFPEGKKAYESQTRERLRLELHALRNRTSGALVVHLCGLARNSPPKTAQEKDDVFILPGDADPADVRTWLSLRDVLAALRESPAGPKLLILDIMRPVADPRLGTLGDDVGTRVQEVLASEPLTNLLVLCACGKGETSLVSENLKHSAFAYYLDQGLRGPADGLAPQGREDRRIMVRELANYVAERVQRWARLHRGAVQKPVLVGQGDDFPLVHLDQDSAETIPTWHDLSAPPAWIRSGWELRDKWADEETFRVAPRLFRDLESLLLRAEERWLGGFEEERLKSELKAEIDILERQRRKALEVPRPEAFSLAMARNRSPIGGKDDLRVADPALKDALDELLRPTRIIELTGKPGDLEKGLTPFKEKFKTAPVVPLGWTAFEIARNLPAPSPGQVFVLRQAIAALHPDARYVEILHLRRLDELRQRVAENEWTWPSAAVAQSLQTTYRAELALAEVAAEPGFLPQMLPFMRKADDSRRQGEKSLFTGPPSSWPGAQESLARADRLYREIVTRVDFLKRAKADYDEATVLLPGYQPFLVNLLDLDSQEEARWKAAIGAARKLGDLLESADESLGGSELDHHADLRQQLNGVKRFFSARRQRFLDRANQHTARDYLDFLALRTNPRPTVREREALWKSGAVLAGELQKLVDDPAAVLSTPIDAEAGRKARRAAFSIDLLRLAGAQGVDVLQQHLDKRNFDDVATGLRDAWTKKLPAQLKASENELARADRLSRFLPPGVGRSTDPTHWSYSPASLLARNQGQTLLRWLGERYRAEGREHLQGSPMASFYSQAADSCLR